MANEFGKAEVRFGGRTLEVKIMINTDETVESVVARVAPAAKGPGQRMVIITAGELLVDSAAELWAKVFESVSERSESRKG